MPKQDDIFKLALVLGGMWIFGQVTGGGNGGQPVFGGGMGGGSTIPGTLADVGGGSGGSGEDGVDSTGEIQEAATEPLSQPVAQQPQMQRQPVPKASRPIRAIPPMGQRSPALQRAVERQGTELEHSGAARQAQRARTAPFRAMSTSLEHSGEARRAQQARTAPFRAVSTSLEHSGEARRAQASRSSAKHDPFDTGGDSGDFTNDEDIGDTTPSTARSQQKQSSGGGGASAAIFG